MSDIGAVTRMSVSVEGVDVELYFPNPRIVLDSTWRLQFLVDPLTGLIVTIEEVE